MITQYLSILSLALLMACASSPQKGEGALAKPETPSNVGATKSPQKVKVILPEIDDFSDLVSASGRIVPVRQVEVAITQSGIIDQVLVSHGQSVKKGALIATLASEQLELDLKAAQVTLDIARHDFQNLLADYQDTVSLGENWVRIKRTMRMKSRLDAALVSYEQAAWQLSQTKVYAAMDGIVSDVQVHPGVHVSASTVVCRLQSPTYRMEAEVLEYDMPGLKIGQEVEVTPLALGQAINGRIEEINPRIDQRGFAKVWVGLPVTSGVYPGMSAKATIRIKGASGLLVPSTAVVNKSGRQVVFSLEEGLAKWNYVTLGQSNGQVVAVLEGLAPDFPVIVSNNLRLAHDSPVEVID